MGYDGVWQSTTETILNFTHFLH